VRIFASIVLVLTVAACRNDHKRNSNEANRQMQAARPLAGCYLLSGDSVGPYRVQLYSWRTARAWVARPIEADGAGGATSDEWSWNPAGADSFDVSYSVADSVMEFAVRRAGSSWSAVLVSASADTAPGTATPARAKRVACPSADAGVAGSRG
jgi:hypothetical protein